MIVLCHKALDSKDSEMERDFLRYFLKRSGERRAVVSNAVWDTWRDGVAKKYKGDGKANKLISLYRSWIRPEIICIGKDYDEIPPKIVVNENELVKSTIDLINRRSYAVSFLIALEPEKYTGLQKIPMTLRQFFLFCMNKHAYRNLVEDFSRKSFYERN